MSKSLFPAALMCSMILTFFLCTGHIFAQSADPKATMVATAVEMKEDIPRLLPAVQKIREAALRQGLTNYFNTCLAISEKVIRVGATMSDTQFKQFQMDYLKAEQSLPQMGCESCTTELCKAVCACKAEGKPITQCVADKAPPEGY